MHKCIEHEPTLHGVGTQKHEIDIPEFPSDRELSDIANNGTKPHVRICVMCNALGYFNFVCGLALAELPQPFEARSLQPVVTIGNARTDESRTVAPLHSIKINANN